MPELHDSQGYLFLLETKLQRSTLATRRRPQIAATEPFKRYPGAEKVLLPRRWDGEEGNLWQALQRRRSNRNFAASPIARTDLALLLWASQGVTAQAGPCCLRTAPSAGALYPIETYVAVQRVQDVPGGLFHFDVRGFHLERLTREVPARQLADAALNQAFFAQAGAVFVWSGALRRTMSKYGHRGARYILIEVGHMCQNLLLAAEALGLAACPVAAFYDDELNAMLGLDGDEETVIYLAAVGHRSRQGRGEAG